VGTAAHRDAGVTKREHEVWSLVAAHLTNQEIADRLHLSVRTVESHVSALMQKLQLADRRALARHAVPSGSIARWPAPISSFVGREAECSALLAALADHRMVTATGPGGVGKTRLALRVVEAFAATRRDGGRFVDLVQVNDPAMVVSAMASAAGVLAPLGGSLADALAASLADSDAVLLIDNCEHVIDAVHDAVSRLLRACPKLTIVATSRVALRAPFEWLFPVTGLSIDAEGGDAVALFVERAHAAGVRTPLDRRRVGALCASLDGMALAIELAAARCRVLGLDGLINGLGRGLGLLSAGTGEVERHRSLRGAIEWSYRLLSTFDREVFAAISVFASWFDVEAAVAVVGGSAARRPDISAALARLAEHSLLLAAPGEPTRYRALETIRQFGAEQLDRTGRREAVARLHRAWCHAALETLAGQPRDDAWCERLDHVADDVRAALAWAADQPAAPRAAPLAERLAEQLLVRGRPHESQRGYEQAARLADVPGERARLLRLAAGAAASRLVGNDTLRLLQQAADCAVAAGDRAAAAVDLAWMGIFVRWAPGIIAALPPPEQSARWLALATQHSDGTPAIEAALAAANALGLPDGDAHAEALASHAIALARQAGVPLIESLALDVLCTFHLARHQVSDAVRKTTERASAMDTLALDASTAYHFNDYLLMASEMHLVTGRLKAAAEYADRLGELACYRDYPHPAIARRIEVDALAGDFEAAVQRGDRFLQAWERAGRPVSGTLNVTAYAMAMVHGLLGDEAGRARWIEVTTALVVDPRRLTTCETGWAPTFDALLALDRGDADAALARLSTDIDDVDLWRRSTAARWRPWYAALWAEASVLSRHPDAAARLQRAAAAVRDNEIAITIVKRATDLLCAKRKALRSHAPVFALLGCDYQCRRTEVLALGAS
jgi:predicted ATPase/DNA-binding CsgD family transcriptional regulator